MDPVPVVLPTRGIVIFPGTIRIFPIGRASSLAAVDRHLETGRPLVVVPQVDPDEEDPLRAEISCVGVRVSVLRATRLNDGTLRVLVEGHERVRIASDLGIRDDATEGRIDAWRPNTDDPAAARALASQLAEVAQEYTQSTGLQPHEHAAIAAGASDPQRLADQALCLGEPSLEAQIQQLEEPSVEARLQAAIEHLSTGIAKHRLMTDVHSRVQRSMDDGQREYHLKEQLKIIRTELGESFGAEAEADQFANRVRESAMPKEAKEEALRESERLRRAHTDSAEYTIIRTWLETICDLPWGRHTVDERSLKKASAVLDADHHGLNKVKERVLEYLAVRQLAPQSKGAILCFVGPPGVGKTSLGRSIARALGREFGRIALGGVKDETEIRGHRRTYIGALPGRILRALSRAGTANPLLVLDEIDKVGNDFRGDPASALLEVLDPEQNHAFVDHYVDLPVDLSQVLFIATANLLDPIPPALHDRLEIIEISGYTEEEKVEIAQRHMLPRLAANHGLTDKRIQVDKRAIQRAIRDYTREAGVRSLERQLATMHRKVARRIVENDAERVRITAKTVIDYLGPPKFFQELADSTSSPGVATGLAWTEAGGDILFVEAARMHGKRGLKLTGCLGDVMKESAEAALSWFRSRGDVYGVRPEAFDSEIHLHVPAGAIPKDGPSAGVTIVTALVSLITGRPAESKLAMTGEITLRGKVLPVGGVKEKVLAARRAGIRKIVLPSHNQNDLADLPDELRTDVSFVFVEQITDVIEVALGLTPQPNNTTRRSSSTSQASSRPRRTT